MKRAVLFLFVLVAVIALTGCGSTRETFSGRVIHIGRGVQLSSLTKSVLGIKPGAEAAVVRTRLGRPINEDRSRGLTCSWYRAEQADSALDGLGFCANSMQRVERILLAVHG